MAARKTRKTPNAKQIIGLAAIGLVGLVAVKNWKSLSALGGYYGSIVGTALSGFAASKASNATTDTPSSTTDPASSNPDPEASSS